MEKRRTESRRCDKDRKRVGEGEREKRYQREKEKRKMQGETEKKAEQGHMKESGRKYLFTCKSVNRKNFLFCYSSSALVFSLCCITFLYVLHFVVVPLILATYFRTQVQK